MSTDCDAPTAIPVPVPSDELVRCLELCHEFARRSAAIGEAMAECPGTHPRENAALRRTSMELTRALAELRRVYAYRWEYPQREYPQP